MRVIDNILFRFGYLKKETVDSQLNFSRSVAKRLDEHRETVEAIQEKTTMI